MTGAWIYLGVSCALVITNLFYQKNSSDSIMNFFIIRAIVDVFYAFFIGIGELIGFA